MPRTIRSYRDLEAWREAMDLVIECYRLTKGFPDDEQFGLVSQIRRAAVSVAANIAEGRERHGSKEFLHHLSIAYGSLAEVETHLEVAARLSFLKGSQLDSLRLRTATVGKLINGLRRSLVRSR